MTREVGGSSPPSRVEKFYVIGRADLDTGARAVQMGHAAIDWVLEHGAPPETIVFLQVRDESALEELLLRLRGRMTPFREPDFDRQLTAIAAGPKCWRQLSSIGKMR